MAEICKSFSIYLVKVTKLSQRKRSAKPRHEAQAATKKTNEWAIHAANIG